jgi:hypothetical protein
MSTVLPVSVPHQGADFWCWAAVTAGVLQYRTGQTLQPCEVAQRTFPSLSCCADQEPCDRTNELEQVLNLFGLLRSPTVPGSLSPTQLIQEIVGRQVPVGVRIVFRAGPVHFVLITGLHDSGALVVQDPFGPVQHTLTWVDMANRYPGDGFWDETYLIG